MADTSSPLAKAPWHLWVVGAVSLVWNLFGAMDFMMTETRNQAYLKALTPAQLDFFLGFPFWVVTTWGVAVWGGVLGSLLLLLRRRQASHLLLASTICIVLTDFHNFALSDGMSVMGGAGPLIFAAIILAVGVLLFIYARAITNRRVLR